MPYGREQMALMAQDLVGLGFSVWNLEYRRVGAPGGGWPGTLKDVSAGIDHLAVLAADGTDLDLTRVIVVGHSAGAHLALLAAAAGGSGHDAAGPSRVRPSLVVGLAPLVDLASTYARHDGEQPIGEFLGGSPLQQPDRYAAASPGKQLPLGVKQLILHGTLDADVPIAPVRTYARTALDAGDEVEFIELPGAGHMDYLDLGSAAYATLRRRLMVHAKAATPAFCDATPPPVHP